MKGLGKKNADDEPLSRVTVLGINGYYDALWAWRCVGSEGEKPSRLFAIWGAQRAADFLKTPDIMEEDMVSSYDKIRAGDTVETSIPVLDGRKVTGTGVVIAVRNGYCIVDHCPNGIPWVFSELTENLRKIAPAQEE